MGGFLLGLELKTVVVIRISAKKRRDWSKTPPDMIAMSSLDFVLWSYSTVYAIQPENPSKHQNTAEYIAGESFHSFPGTEV